MKRRTLGDWADLVYDPEHFEVAHIRPFGQHFSLCGGTPLGLDGWWGTGDMNEIEAARNMPRCPECVARIPSDQDQIFPA